MIPIYRNTIHPIFKEEKQNTPLIYQLLKICGEYKFNMLHWLESLRSEFYVSKFNILVMTLNIYSGKY